MKICSLLIVGLDVGSLAFSVKNAGYEVSAVDYFGDSDLRNSCSLSFSVIAQREGVSCGRVGFDFNPQNLLVLARKAVDRHEFDGILLSSGLEDYPRIISALNELAPIIGNSPRMISRVRDKEHFFTELKRIGVSHPETEIVKTFEEAKSKARNIGYPVVVKPEKGFGGSGLRRILNRNELEAVISPIRSGGRFLIQEFVKGKAASASIISTTSEARMLTVNEQLLGKRSLGQREPFGYCGNIVPLEIDGTVAENCREVVEKIVHHFHLVGSNGVDFVVTEEGLPEVIEVNPRFQGTLECIERVLKINVAKAHVEACTLGVLPSAKETRGSCTRLVLYALKHSRVPVLDKFENIRDIPLKGVIVEKGEPLCSVFAEGPSRAVALREARKLAHAVYCSIL